jgi:hypothetical protein
MLLKTEKIDAGLEILFSRLQLCLISSHHQKTVKALTFGRVVWLVGRVTNQQLPSFGPIHAKAVRT